MTIRNWWCGRGWRWLDVGTDTSGWASTLNSFCLCTGHVREQNPVPWTQTLLAHSPGPCCASRRPRPSSSSSSGWLCSCRSDWWGRPCGRTSTSQGCRAKREQHQPGLPVGDIWAPARCSFSLLHLFQRETTCCPHWSHWSSVRRVQTKLQTKCWIKNNQHVLFQLLLESESSYKHI